MAKVIITIEDLPGEKVKIVTEPSMEQIIRMDVSGFTPLTAAEGMAFKVLNGIRLESKKNQQKNNGVLTSADGF